MFTNKGLALHVVAKYVENKEVNHDLGIFQKM